MLLKKCTGSFLLLNRNNHFGTSNSTQDKGRAWYGNGKDYKPWLYVQDVPSQGRSHRVYSHKTERVHHLLSNNYPNRYTANLGHFRVAATPTVW